MNNLYSFEAEQSVIGSCILDSEYAWDKISFLTVDDFFNSVHKAVYAKVKETIESGSSIDLIILAERFTKDELQEIGGFAYLADLAKNTPSARNCVAYADMVRSFSNKRTAITSMRLAIQDLQEGTETSVTVIDKLQSDLDKTFISAAEADVFNIEQLISLSLDEMDKSSVNHRIGLQSGVPEVDARLGYKGLAFGEITALGALSKNGKTLMANTIAARADFRDGESAHIFSIEMPAVSMFNGIISAMSGVPSNFYVRQDMYHRVYGNAYDTMMAKWGAAAQELKSSGRITIDGTKQVNAEFICSNMKKQFAIHRNNGKRLRLVVIDHIHRMEYDAKGGPLTYAIRDAMRKIKNTAAELDVAVLALCQLNNNAEDKDPTSFHILDSSSVRHEMQAFIGTRIFKQDGNVHFGVYGDSQRYGDMDTEVTPAYMRLDGGVLKSLGEGECFIPFQDKTN